MDVEPVVSGEVTKFTLTPRDFGFQTETVFSQDAADSLVGQAVKVQTPSGVRSAAVLDGTPVEARITATRLIDNTHVEITVQVLPIVIPDSIEGWDL